LGQFWYATYFAITNDRQSLSVTDFPKATTSLPSALALRTPSRVTLLDGALIALMIVWGANFVVIKTALEVLSPIVFNGLRFSLGALVIGVLFRLNGVQLILPRREWPALIVLGLAGVVYQALFTYGLHTTSVANNALIIASAPVWVVLANVIRRQERITRGAVLGVFLALGGVGLVVLSRLTAQEAGGQASLAGDLISLVASWVWAFNILISRKPLERNPTLPATFWIVAWGALAQMILAVPDLIHMDWSVLNSGVLLGLLYAGIMSIGLGNAIWNRGVKVLGTARTTVYTYLEPIVAAVTAILFLGEPFTLWLVVGATLVLIGLALVKKA
jgi:drug/metabolite transporter (DMT)-like permease